MFVFFSRIRNHFGAGYYIKWVLLPVSISSSFRALVCNIRTFSKIGGHLTSPIWLKFGTKADFRVLTTKWVLESSSCFCLAKIDKAGLVCPYFPANKAYRRCSYDFNWSTVVEIS